MCLQGAGLREAEEESRVSSSALIATPAPDVQHPNVRSCSLTFGELFGRNLVHSLNDAFAFETLKLEVICLDFVS